MSHPTDGALPEAWPYLWSISEPHRQVSESAYIAASVTRPRDVGIFYVDEV